MPLINRHVNSRSAKIRKWAYHCVCFCWNDTILKSVKHQLKKEKKIDNILWALIALSVYYNTEETLRTCVGNRHDEFMEILSRNYLSDALLLFGEMININPKILLLNNNPLDLIALTTVYGYKNLVNDKYDNINETVMKEIQKNPIPHIREYGYWATVLRNDPISLHDVKNDTDMGVLKWQLVGKIKCNEPNYIVSILKKIAVHPHEIHFEVKSGIIRGIQEVPYNEKYVPYVCRWFSYENNNSIVFRIIDYMLSNCYNNKTDGTYFDAIKDSLSDKQLSVYIHDKINHNSNYKLSIVGNAGNYTIDFIEKEKSVMSVKTTIKGDVNGPFSIAMASDNSTATSTATNDSSQKDNIEQVTNLINEVRDKAAEELSDDDKKTVNESLNYIENEIKTQKPNYTIIKTLLNGMQGIMNAVGFGVALKNLIDFFNNFK